MADPLAPSFIASSSSSAHRTNPVSSYCTPSSLPPSFSARNSSIFPSSSPFSPPSIPDWENAAATLISSSIPSDHDTVFGGALFPEFATPRFHPFKHSSNSTGRYVQFSLSPSIAPSSPPSSARGSTFGFSASSPRPHLLGAHGPSSPPRLALRPPSSARSSPSSPVSLSARCLSLQLLVTLRVFRATGNRRSRSDRLSEQDYRLLVVISDLSS